MRKLFVFMFILCILTSFVGITTKTVVDNEAPKIIESNEFIQNNSMAIELLLNVIKIDGMQKTGTVNERIASLVTPQTARKLLGDGVRVTGLGMVTIDDFMDGMTYAGLEYNLHTILKDKLPKWVINQIPTFVWFYANSPQMFVLGIIGAIVSLLLVLISTLIRRRNM